MAWVLAAADPARRPPPAAATVCDLGAGTGACTRVLAAHVRRVVAVEADPRMAQRYVAACRSPLIAVGTAESMPLADASVDAVVVASAWHWMDPVRAVSEIARVLRPGGAFGILWSGPDRAIDWVTAALGGDAFAAGRATSPYTPESIVLGDDAPFGPAETARFDDTISLDVEALVRLAGTYSPVIVLDRAERAAFDAAVRATAASQLAAAGGDRLALPLRARCWRAQRR